MQVDHVSLPIGSDPDKKSNDASVETLLAGDPSPEQLRERMKKTYGNFVFASAEQYATLFSRLEHDSLPLLYHCSAGKDRTGVFSALLLLTLGVPEKTALEDYALTNKYLLNGGQSEAIKKMSASAGDGFLSRLSPEQRNVLMAADPAYLESTLREIDTKYGSFDNYRRQALHVSDADLKELRAKLLVE
jgi:protein-tyrosine phosphatase